MVTKIAIQNNFTREQLQQLLERGVKIWFTHKDELNQVDLTYNHRKIELEVPDIVITEINKRLGGRYQNTINQLIYWGTKNSNDEM